MTTKTIIIPIGFNAEQCKRGVLSYFADDITTEWMSDQDFVQQYLYCQEDGDYDPPLEVWLLVWDSPSNMIKPPKGGCSSLYVKCLAVGVNLTWCKVHHKGLTIHVISETWWTTSTRLTIRRKWNTRIQTCRSGSS